MGERARVGRCVAELAGGLSGWGETVGSSRPKTTLKYFILLVVRISVVSCPVWCGLFKRCGVNEGSPYNTSRTHASLVFYLPGAARENQKTAAARGTVCARRGEIILYENRRPGYWVKLEITRSADNAQCMYGAWLPVRSENTDPRGTCTLLPLSSGRQSAAGATAGRRGQLPASYS